MSWFNDQLKLRQQKDDEFLSDALDSIAGAVMGRRLVQALEKDEIAQNALEEIIRFFHFKVKSDPIPPQVKDPEEQMEYRLRPYGISRRTVTLTDKWYKNAVGPMLATFRDDGTAVALIPGKLSGYTYYDHRIGKRIKVNKKTAKNLDEEAICFYKPLPLKSLNIRDLLKYMAEQLSLSDIVIYIGMMAVSAVLGLLSPMFTKWLFGYVLDSQKTRVLLALAGFMVSYSICNLCLSAFKSLISSRITVKQDIAVQAAVMNRMLSLPPTFFKEYSSGELVQRSNYVQSLCRTLMETIGMTGLSSLFSLIYIGQIFSFAPALVVPSLLITLATILISLILTFSQMRITKEKMLESSKTSGLTYAMITGIQKIKLAGAEKRMFSRWAGQYAKEASLEYNPPLFLKLGKTISLAVSLIGGMVLFYLAAKSKVGVANYYAFNTSYGMVSSAFTSLAGIVTTLANIKPTLEMARPILAAEPELAEGKEIITSLSGGIELNNVCFQYEENGPKIIDDLSLKIKAGEYIAIVGKTGCGKTTLIRLLLGFEKPQKGAIYYGGKDINRVDLRSLRRKIGAVMQDGKLFLGDIYSNIVISAPQLTLNDAWEAAKAASVDDDIRAMPMGMHTIISEGQGGISGGQRQRLMIARAIAPKPKILIFDEATSALDNVTQKKVSKAIDALNCTRIVIAHRLSTIQNCDRIIVLDQGRIIEDGTYASLIEKNGFFAELVARQRLDLEQEEVSV